MRKEKILFQKKIKVGYDGEHPVFVEATITEVDISKQEVFKYVNGEKVIVSKGNTKETINHRHVKKYRTLSMGGNSYNSAGQIVGEIPKLKRKIPQWRRLVKLWKEWHLNDLQAGCKHQKQFSVKLENWQARADKETAKCPKGYNYGSKWLLKPLPMDVQREIKAIFNKKKI